MELLSPLRHRLVHFARVMTGDYEEARDLVSDTVLAALERFDRVNDQQAFLSYLFTVATRIHRRKRWRLRLFSTYDERHALERHDRGTAPDVSVDVAALYRALGELPEPQREAVALFEISGLSLEEIREIQGGSLSGVKMRLSRGRQKLADLLGAGPTQAAGAEGSNGVSTVVTVANENERGNHQYLIYSRPYSNG